MATPIGEGDIDWLQLHSRGHIACNGGNDGELRLLCLDHLVTELSCESSEARLL